MHATNLMLPSGTPGSHVLGLSLGLGASSSCQLFLSLLLEALDILCTSTVHDKHSLVTLHDFLGAG